MARLEEAARAAQRVQVAPLVQAAWAALLELAAARELAVRPEQVAPLAPAVPVWAGSSPTTSTPARWTRCSGTSSIRRATARWRSWARGPRMRNCTCRCQREPSTIRGTSNTALRVMQPAADEDFELEVKFESEPTQAYQSQGLLVEQDAYELHPLRRVQRRLVAQHFRCGVHQHLAGHSDQRRHCAGVDDLPAPRTPGQSVDRAILLRRRELDDGRDVLPLPHRLWSVGVFAGNFDPESRRTRRSSTTSSRPRRPSSSRGPVPSAIPAIRSRAHDGNALANGTDPSGARTKATLRLR